MSSHSKKLAPVVKTEKDSGGPKPFSSSTKGNALTRVKSGFVAKKSVNKSFVEKSIQTDHPDVALITGDEPPLEYWKLLAEERLKDIEKSKKDIRDLKVENATWKEKHSILLARNEFLEKEVETLDNIAEDARRMAEIIEALPDDYAFQCNSRQSPTHDSDVDDDDSDDNEDNPSSNANDEENNNGGNNNNNSNNKEDQH